MEVFTPQQGVLKDSVQENRWSIAYYPVSKFILFTVLPILEIRNRVIFITICACVAVSFKENKKFNGK